MQCSKLLLKRTFLGSHGPLRVPLISVLPSVPAKNLNKCKLTTNHYIIMSDLFSESSWPPQYPLTLRDDKDNYKYTHIQIHKSCAIFFKSMGMGVKDIKYDIPVWHGHGGHSFESNSQDHLADLSRTFGLVLLPPNTPNTEKMFIMQRRNKGVLWRVVQWQELTYGIENYKMLIFVLVLQWKFTMICDFQGSKEAWLACIWHRQDGFGGVLDAFDKTRL